MGATVISTVTQPAASYDLTTLDVIKDELDIKDNSKNKKLQRWLTEASADIAQYCNRVLPAEIIQDEFWAQRDPAPRIIPGRIPHLQLSRWPIQSVTSVVERGITLNGDPAVGPPDFRIDAANGKLIRLDKNLWPRPWPDFPIVIVYVGGFAKIPPDVQGAVIRMVKARYNARPDPMLRQQSVPGVIEQNWWIATGSETGNMSPDITDILDNYRVPVVTA
jgi:hypothetical protein